jgi:hypothetical protein
LSSVSMLIAKALALRLASAWRPVSMSCQMWPSADPDGAPRTMKCDSIPVLSRK